MKTVFKKFIYRIAKRIVLNHITQKQTPLTPKYLIDRGWAVNGNGDYFEPNVKDRDIIYITFEAHYYRVWHSSKRTFIALESCVEWFEWYYLIIHPDHRNFPEENKIS